MLLLLGCNRVSFPTSPSMVLPTGPHASEPLSPLAQIQQLLERQAAAWNSGDIDGFMAAYWQSPELSFAYGKESFRGWQSTLDRYRRIYQLDGRQMGQLTVSDLIIQALGPSGAFVRGRWQMVTNRDSINGLFTLILRKLPEGWRIVHDHTSS